MISCSQAVQDMWTYLDGHLGDPDRALIDEHLARCRRCCGEMDFARELRRFLADAAHESLPADALQRLNQTLEELDP